jgi:hypothetical protein
MADQADVYIKNLLNDAIEVTRIFLDSYSDLDITIASGNEEMFYIIRSETYLIIKLPCGVYTADCPFIVSNEELLSWSTMDDHWTVEIKPNSLPPDTPTTTNVIVG